MPGPYLGLLPQQGPVGRNPYMLPSVQQPTLYSGLGLGGMPAMPAPPTAPPVPAAAAAPQSFGTTLATLAAGMPKNPLFGAGQAPGASAQPQFGQPGYKDKLMPWMLDKMYTNPSDAWNTQTIPADSFQSWLNKIFPS